MVSIMESGGNDIVISGYVREEVGNGKQTIKNGFGDSNMDLVEQITVCHENTLLFDVWNKLFLKRIIDDNNIRFPNKKRLEDADFVYRYLEYSSRIGTNKKVAYHYRVFSSTGASATVSYFEQTFNLVCYPTFCEGQKLVIDLQKKGFPENEVEAFSEKLRKHLYVGMTGDFVTNLARSDLSFLDRYSYIKNTLDEFYKLDIKINSSWDYNRLDQIIRFFVTYKLITPIVILSFMYQIKHQ